VLPSYALAATAGSYAAQQGRRAGSSGSGAPRAPQAGIAAAAAGSSRSSAAGIRPQAQQQEVDLRLGTYGS
jgi:hypothetical protein